MDIIGLAIGLLSGAAGGNVAGKLLNSSMGTMGRSVTGVWEVQVLQLSHNIFLAFQACLQTQQQAAD